MGEGLILTMGARLSVVPGDTVLNLKEKTDVGSEASEKIVLAILAYLRRHEFKNK